MLFFSSLLRTDRAYKSAADKLSAALDLYNIKYKFLSNTKDIWLRDFMPVKTGSGRYVSFRYDPGYLCGYPGMKTVYRRDLSKQMMLSGVTYSDITLDGGNVVFSPSKQKAIISDRIFSENPEYGRRELIEKLEQLLEAEVIIIPSLKSDMTGHADGMVRFLDEDTVLGNDVPGKYTLEKRIAAVLTGHGLKTVGFPYFNSRGMSAEGCYLNYLETDSHIFLPVFDDERDAAVIRSAEAILPKKVVPVCVSEIGKLGGCLNCISWEN